MKLANITISQIISIINGMSYTKVKNSLDYWDSPIKVDTYCSETQDHWSYQVFKETIKIKPSYQIKAVTLMIYNPDYKQYDQDVTIKITFSGNSAHLVYENKKQAIRTIVKYFNRNVKQLQECVLEKMNEEVKKTQMRNSLAKTKKAKEQKKLISQLIISV